MKLFLAQLNNIVGDIDGNLNKAIDVLQDAKKLNSDLVIFFRTLFIWISS